MSRSLTPKELLAFEDAVVSTGGMSVLDTMAGIVFEQEGGEPVRLYSDAEIAARQKFPLLGKLMDSGEYGFMRLYERLQKIEGGIDWLRAEENELAEYLKKGYVELEEPGELEPVVVRWFNGELDKGFYYREENDRLLVEHILDEAFVFSGRQNEEYIRYRQDWYEANGISGKDIVELKEAYELDVEKGRFVGGFRRYEVEFGYRNGECCMEPLEKLIDEGAFAVERELGKALSEATERSEQTVGDGDARMDERVME